MLQGFINTGLDAAMAKSIASKRGLTPVQKQVTVNGRTFTRTYYVSNGEAEKMTSQSKKSEPEQTVEKYKDKSGMYTPERAKLHKEIVDKIVASAGDPKPGCKPVVVLMGGGSASGKSTIKRNVVDVTLSDAGLKAANVDSDEIKDSIPEYAQYKKDDPEHAAMRVHEESSDIGAMALDELISKGKNFIFDGTMKNAAKYDKLVDRMKQAGYEIQVVVADVPLNIAIERSDKRAKHTGRKVPHDIIEASHKGVPQTLTKIKNKVDAFSVWDNSGATPELIADNNFMNKEKFHAFLNKGGVKHD